MTQQPQTDLTVIHFLDFLSAKTNKHDVNMENFSKDTKIFIYDPDYLIRTSPCETCSKNSRWKIHCNVWLSCVIESCVYSWWLFSNYFLSFASAGYSLATRSHMIRLQSKRVNFTLSCLSVCLSLCVCNAIPRNSNLSLQSPLKRERKEKGETTTTHLDDPPFLYRWWQ